MAITIRPLEVDHDAPDVLPIMQQLYPDMDNRTYQHFMRREYPFDRYMVAVHDDTIVGLSWCYREKTDPRNRANVMIAVHPDYMQQGVGTALFDDVEAAARGQVMRELRGQVTEDPESPEYLFAQRLGFREQHHMVRAALDLNTFDDKQIRSVLEELSEKNIEFTTLADEGDAPENRAKVYKINKMASDNMPNRHQEAFSIYEAYEEGQMSSSTHPPQGVFIAVQGERWIGMTQVSFNIDQGYAVSEMTAVLPGYDRRLISRALLLLAARFSRDQGFEEFRTLYDEANDELRQVKEDVGFEDRPGYFMMVKGIR